MKYKEEKMRSPISSKELVIKHFEFTIKFGKWDVLDIASREMTFVQYYNLDIIIPFITLLFFKN
uniref:Glucuronosyltransferase n=1 Tax=Parastrongyloides trichosuri TaxID=131310 RepID=A0A0N4ZHW1_PARTI